MHADGGRGEGVVGRKEEGSPVLTIFVRCFGRAGKDVVPSVLEVEGLNYNEFKQEWMDRGTNSRILDSDGWAMM